LEFEFVIYEDGSTHNINKIAGLKSPIDQNIYTIISNTRFIPATLQSGKKVKFAYVLPVRIR
jgi:hypothetical protein